MNMELLRSVASLVEMFTSCQTLVHNLVPRELRLKLFACLFNSFSSHCYYDITEIDGVNTNELYNAAKLYLSSSISTSHLSLSLALNSSAVTFNLANNNCLIDVFNGVQVHWEHLVTPRQTQDKQAFILKIKKQDNPTLIFLNAYLDHVMEKANEIRLKNKDRFLYTNSSCGSLWESVPFKHPSTFDTLAMDPANKEEIMADLTDFANGQAFYQNTGLPWKRNYLLYGPPGSGKSSMIAAMANFLCYDVYYLELTEVQKNSDLRKLLMKTSSKSIIVIKDIDCLTNLTSPHGRNHHEGSSATAAMAGDQEGGNAITLSGLLNFRNGLWECCGSERIFVFTTNHIEKMDPAFLRMDMHVCMSYCSFPALKILLKNYLGFEEGYLSGEVLGALEGLVEEAQMMPGDVSEVLMKNRRDKAKAVGELVEALKGRAEMRSENGGGVMRERGLEEVVVEKEVRRSKRTKYF